MFDIVVDLLDLLIRVFARGLLGVAVLGALLSRVGVWWIPQAFQDRVLIPIVRWAIYFVLAFGAIFILVTLIVSIMN